MDAFAYSTSLGFPVGALKYAVLSAPGQLVVTEVATFPTGFSRFAVDDGILAVSHRPPSDSGFGRFRFDVVQVG